jgi:hypothetical protein
VSKVKKKPTRLPGGLSKEDIQLEKIIQFSGWIFLLVLILFMGAWIVLDFFLDIIELELSASTFTFIIFIGTNSAISFALASKIKNDRGQRKKFFYDWLIGEFLFSMLSIFTVAAYQW